MLELYHHGSSVCAAKVRMVLSEKELDWNGHYIDILKGEQFDPKYLKLNPKAVVPTLIHDGDIIRESTVICEYLDHAFPVIPLRPAPPLEAARMRVWTKFIDEVIHPSCAVITFTCSHRFSMPPEEIEGFLNKTPDAGLRQRKHEWFELGFQGPDFIKSVKAYDKLLADMETMLSDQEWLAGASFSLADIGVIPYVNRLAMLNMLDPWQPDRPLVSRWFDRMKARASFEPAINEYMPESLANDLRTNGTASWPEVEKVLPSSRG